MTPWLWFGLAPCSGWSALVMSGGKTAGAGRAGAMSRELSHLLVVDLPMIELELVCLKQVRANS